MSSIATPLCIALIIWMFRSDLRLRHFSSRALWIPAIWLAVIASRPVSLWTSGVLSVAQGGVDGNPINVLVQGSLICSAIVVLARRRIAWRDFASQNKALLALYLFYLLSVCWSEYPLASFKRLFKDFGGILIGLVLLTSEDPEEAIRTVFVRVSYLALPLSLLFIKYYPAIGRGRTNGGDQDMTGVCTQKNSLGETALVLSLVILWDLLALSQSHGGPLLKTAKRIRWLLLGIGLWLFQLCQSRTSLLALVAGGCFLVLTPYLGRMRRPKALLGTLFACVALLAILNSIFGLSDMVLAALGRNSTLTGRTGIWEAVKAQPINPVLGNGYYCFWDSDKGLAVQTTLNNPINEAHNGYLETFVDGGMIAVMLLAILLLTWGKRTYEAIATGTLYGGLGFAFWLATLIFNWAESGFFRLMPLWFTVVLVTLSPQPWRSQPASAKLEVEDEAMPLELGDVGSHL